MAAPPWPFRLLRPSSGSSRASNGDGPAPGRRPLPATWLKKSHFAGGERQLQALLRSVPADDHVLVAKKCSGRHGGARLRLRRTHGRSERGQRRCQTRNKVINTTINQVMLIKMARNCRIEVDSTLQWAKRRGRNRYEMQREGGRRSNNHRRRRKPVNSKQQSTNLIWDT